MQNSVHYKKINYTAVWGPVNLTAFSPMRKAYIFTRWKNTIPIFNFQEPTKSKDIFAVPKKHP